MGKNPKILNTSASTLTAVLLNISASCLCLLRKANVLFEKNAAPILHLAGVEITVVKVWIVGSTRVS